MNGRKNCSSNELKGKSLNERKGTKLSLPDLLK